MVDRDPSLDVLLELDGTILVIGPAGHWVKFDVKRVKPSAERPHGLAYSLTLHAPDGKRLIGFDNAHAIRASRGPAGKQPRAYDHKHRLQTTRPYRYADATSLLEAFWNEVYSFLDQQGAQR
jgi:hypothetical protein